MPEERQQHPWDLGLPVDPIQFGAILWPEVKFYKQQREIIYSVVENPETFVVAGNELGKDFVAAFIALHFFLCHREVRVMCTSVKDDHLRVLFGEIERFIQTAAYPLTRKVTRDKMVGRSTSSGGPMVVYHRDIRKVIDDKFCKISYLRGAVSERGEGMQGHHARDTLAIVDEASGIDDSVYAAITTWANRILVIGNPLPTQNFFYKAVKGGNIVSPLEAADDLDKELKSA